MLDKDRGTYTPPTEDHLEYDAGPRAQGRDQAPLTLIISGIVLVVLLLAVVLFYNTSLGGHGRAPGEIGTPLANYKDSKIEDAKPIKEDDLLDQVGSGTDVQTPPKMADQAEEPVARDGAAIINEAPAPVAPRTEAIPSNADKAAATSGQVSSPIASNAAQALPKDMAQALTPQTASQKTVVATQAAALKPSATPLAPSPAAKAPVSPTASVANGSYGVQIGAFATQAMAETQYSQIASSYGRFTSGTSRRIEKVERDGKVLYRTSFAGFGTKEKAKAFCEALTQAGKSCFVK